MAKITYLPGEVANAAVDENGKRLPVTRTQHIFDDTLNKPQSQVNVETTEAISDEVTRAQNAESGLDTRLQTVEQLAEISVGGGDIGIGTAADFESDDPSDLAKVPTIGAMLGGANDGVYDISARHSGATYANLAAALGTNGANIPQSLRKGGMSVKFVQSSDNSYIQYRCKTQSFSANPEDWAVSNEGVYIENPEYLGIFVDKENRIVQNIEKDGNILFGAGVPRQIAELIKDKTTIEGKSIKVYLDDTYGEYIENPEFLRVLLDNQRNILLAIKKDGDIYFGFGCPTQIQEFVANYINQNGNSIREYLDNTFGLYISDPEGKLELKTDIDRHILSYRDSKGRLHENAGIATNSLHLSDEGMTEFCQAMKEAGYQAGGGGDFSDNKEVELPEPPRYALVNFVINSIPINDNDVATGYVEYYDMLGNYFRKACSVESQGQSAKHFARTGGKGNFTLDITDDSKIKIGSWVPQDSFHIKGSAKDVTRGMLATSYKYAWLFLNKLNAKPNRCLMDESAITTTNATGERITDWPDDARCLPDGFPCELYINGAYYGLYAWQLKKHRDNYSMDKKDYTSLFIDADAFMTNDYQNGIWNDGPDAHRDVNRTWWTGFDIKGPKDLVCMNGSKFDGDNPAELMSKYYTELNSKWKYTGGYILYDGGVEPTAQLWDNSVEYAVGDTCYLADADMDAWIEFAAVEANTDSAPMTFTLNTNYDNSDKKHKGSRTSKNIIRKWTFKYLEVKALIDNNSIEEAKVKFNQNFDYNACMLVYIFNCFMRNYDSIKKNTLWGTYKDGRIAPFLWDLDGMYGESWMGISADIPSAYIWDHDYADSAWPLSLLWTLFENEIKETYSSLRRDNIISIDTWKNIIFGWNERIGKEAYERDIKRWPETPSYRKNCTDSKWKQIGGYSGGNPPYPQWDENTNYAVGDKVSMPQGDTTHWYYMNFEAVEANQGVFPVTHKYSSFPYYGGYWNSPKRMEKWMAEQISRCDTKLNYSE